MRRFGPYVLLEELDRSTASRVYLAEDSRRSCPVTLTILFGEGKARERFQRGAELASSLDHPGLCGVHEVGVENGIAFIATPREEGATLADALAEARQRPGPASGSLVVDGETGTLDPDALRRWLAVFERTAGALHAAHEIGLRHGDLHPGQILLTDEENPLLLGLGVPHGANAGREGAPYLAPECREGEDVSTRDARTDVYALGLLLRECLSGLSPSRDDSPAGADAASPATGPELSPDFEDVLAAATQEDPKLRFPTAAAFGAALAQIRTRAQIPTRDGAEAVEPVPATSPSPGGLPALAPSPSARFSKGDRQFGRYLLLEELGRGAQGIVYLAEDSSLHRKVALKMLTDVTAQSAQARERFHREAELASKLDHPGVCGVHEFGMVDDIAFIAMQYLTGETLADKIARAKTKPDFQGGAGGSIGADSTTGAITRDGLHQLLRIFERIAEALHAAHEAGLVHRDIKPANIMVTEGDQPVILDFGLARDREASGHTLTQSGQVMGTPAYMPWEQILGKRDLIDRRTDVYALGVTLYECLSLRRPYQAETFDLLFQLILQGAPSNPRKHNPRIPKDLGTVVEVAIDHERSRRYPSARAFGQDLRRVRHLEPIQAKAASRYTRGIKWMRRNPAPTVGFGAIALFALAGSGLLLKQDLDRRWEIADQLLVAEIAVAQGDPVRATEALTRVRDRDPESARARELTRDLVDLRSRLERDAREAEARATAAEARAEAVDLQLAHAELRSEVQEQQASLDADYAAMFDGPTVRRNRVDYADRERKLRTTTVEAERLLQQSREALERATRLEAPWGGSEENRTAFASFYLSRWNEAISAHDVDRAALYRAAVERYDSAGEHRAELLGYGTLTIAAAPTEATLHLFRYEAYEDLRPGADVPRLVPVPTSGIGPAREGEWIEGFAPGDPCLVIEAVDGGSPAESAGLAPGDLILRLDGARAAEGLFLESFLGFDEADLPARVAELNGVEVRDGIDWGAARSRRRFALDQLILEQTDEILECNAESLQPRTAIELLETGAEQSIVLQVLRDGEALELTLTPGEPAGLHAVVCAYPLIRSRENIVAAGAPLELEPGSYLLLASAPGFDATRVPFQVPRLGTIQAAVELEPAGSCPPGFIRLPAGAFIAGGDPLAVEAGPGRSEFVDEVYFATRELSNREWFEFLEDPEIAERIERAGGALYRPREANAPMPLENLGGEEAPVMGISFDDLQDYLEWRNARAAARGEPWIFDLPSELEWEKAARGVDGRAFPWGDRFDYSATVALNSRLQPLFDAPSGVEPRDESPFGVLDTAGHRREWTRDRFQVSAEAQLLSRLRGGCWRYSKITPFRSATRQYSEPGLTSATTGARLIARRLN